MKKKKDVNQYEQLNSVIKWTSKVVDALSMGMQTTKTSIQETQLYEIKRQLALATALIEDMSESEKEKKE